jgi:hypothetical protein
LGDARSRCWRRRFLDRLTAEPMPKHLCTLERIHTQSLVVAADGVVGRWSGYSPSCGWLLRLENASELGITRRPRRVGMAARVKPRRKRLPRIEHAVTPDDPRNRVDRGHLHRPRGRERVRDAVPRKACREESKRGCHSQKQEVDSRGPMHAPMGPHRFGPARRRWRSRLSRRWRRKIVLRRLPRREGTHARREDTHTPIVEPTAPRMKPLKGRALGARLV